MVSFLMAFSHGVSRRVAATAGASEASISLTRSQRATLLAVLQSSPSWLESLAADVEAPSPESPEDLFEVMQMALHRKVIKPLPLRRAPRLDEHRSLDEILRVLFWEEHLPRTGVPEAHHIGRVAVDSPATDVQDMLAFYLGGDDVDAVAGIRPMIGSLSTEQ